MPEHKEFEERIRYNLSKMQRNLHIDVILEEILYEIWKNDDSDFEWKPEPSIILEDKWKTNPEFINTIQIQKDILWRKLIGHLPLGSVNQPTQKIY